MAENYSQSRVPASASASAVYAATRPELAEALLSLMIRVDDARIHTSRPTRSDCRRSHLKSGKNLTIRDISVFIPDVTLPSRLSYLGLRYSLVEQLCSPADTVCQGGGDYSCSRYRSTALRSLHLDRPAQ